MNIFREIKQEKYNLIDPINLFTELSELINESVIMVATAFIRLNNCSSLVNIYPYQYDPINGIEEIPFDDSKNFIKAIVNGYERVIITDEIDDYCAGYWGLSKNGKLDYNINGINTFRPFYFVREEVSRFLEFHCIPLPSCITKEIIDSTNNNCINNDNKLLQRINQLEQELNEQQKINSKFAHIKSSNITDIGHLERENNQLKLNNKKLTEQLNKAQIKIEKLKEQIPILLGKYRADDPLLLAIQIRNKEWSNYNEKDRRTRPTQEAICEDLKASYDVQTDQLAKAIELVSCPINRSK
jgi:regulator of replication initiation timing